MSVTGALAPIDDWHALLRPDVELAAEWWDAWAAQMRAARLTFGGRLNCPFLRPFFLTPADLARVQQVAEAIARMGERTIEAALETPALLDAVGLTEDERALVDLDPGYATASTASRVDAFLLPDTLAFAEYNAESPAGLAYTETLAELFDRIEIMTRFKGTAAVNEASGAGECWVAGVRYSHSWPPLVGNVSSGGPQWPKTAPPMSRPSLFENQR
jgi:hypothetical protein